MDKNLALFPFFATFIVLYFSVFEVLGFIDIYFLIQFLGKIDISLVAKLPIGNCSYKQVLRVDFLENKILHCSTKKDKFLSISEMNL